MSDPNERDSKLVQYMNDVYAKERELESALAEKIETAVKAPSKKRLKKSLKETKAHAKALERRIKKLGGKGALQEVTVKKSPAIKGGEQEKNLGDATTQYVKAHEKISAYLSLETFATKVGDSETAKLAGGIRRDVERMAKYLEGQIKSLSNAVAVAVVPSSQRAKAKAKRAKKAAAKKSAAKPKAAKKASPKPKAAKAKKAAKPKAAKKAAATK